MYYLVYSPYNFHVPAETRRLFMYRCRLLMLADLYGVSRKLYIYP